MSGLRRITCRRWTLGAIGDLLQIESIDVVITLKSRREIEKMRIAGQLVAEAHAIAKELVQPGVTTAEIDRAVDEFFAGHQAEPLFKGYPGKTPFPAATCISVNEQIVHGIPGNYVLKPGDLVSIDTGCRIGGWCGDAAWTYAAGEIDAASARLMQVGQQALEVAIEALATESHWSGVARRIMHVVHSAGFGLVKNFVGHGIGREMHEPPQVPNYTDDSLAKDDFAIEPGLVLAVEPMVNAGKAATKTLKDHWTVVTADGSRSVHFEHTIAMTAQGPERLTSGVGV